MICGHEVWGNASMKGKKIVIISLAVLCATISKVNANEICKDTWKKKTYYDASGKAISRVDRIYDRNGKIQKEHIYSLEGAPEGNYTDYETDEQGRVTEGIVYKENGSPMGITLLYEYDKKGNLSKIIESAEELEQIMLYEYDDEGNVIHRKFLEDQNVFYDEEVENVYDQNNRLIKSIRCIEAEGKETTYYQYNEYGQIIKEQLFDMQNSLLGYFEYDYK
ncbi:hypothetical protein DXA98_13780 [Lachnospiraceae bacterium OF09-6]|nr:hypothetical protein DXA98_13780 [Lachnospiraceae bacterium OF09-6]